jgi:hypothetical protein
MSLLGGIGESPRGVTTNPTIGHPPKDRPAFEEEPRKDPLREPHREDRQKTRTIRTKPALPGPSRQPKLGGYERMRVLKSPAGAEGASACEKRAGKELDVDDVGAAHPQVVHAWHRRHRDFRERIGTEVSHA